MAEFRVFCVVAVAVMVALIWLDNRRAVTVQPGTFGECVRLVDKFCGSGYVQFSYIVTCDHDDMQMARARAMSAHHSLAGYRHLRTVDSHWVADGLLVIVTDHETAESWRAATDPT